MQLFGEMQKRVTDLIRENASTLLTAGGVVGTVTTAVLTGRAGFKAAQILEEDRLDREILEEDRLGHEITEMSERTRKEKVMLVGIYFLPPVLTGSATIGSIIMANRMSAQKAAALAAAYGLAEGRLNEYKEKVAEKLSPAKEKKIVDELAQEQVDKTTGASQIIVVDGEVLCFDRPTGRYFRSTMESIQKAKNSTQAEILHHGYATATYFYDELGLDKTTWTDDVGWNSDRLPELDITTVMSKDDRPCIAIDFQVLPKPDYIPNHY